MFIYCVAFGINRDNRFFKTHNKCILYRLHILPFPLSLFCPGFLFTRILDYLSWREGKINLHMTSDVLFFPQILIFLNHFKYAILEYA